MILHRKTFDAIVIGGGFYGASIAIYLAEVRGLKNVALIEREESLLMRSSKNNQARVHNGYHYPRSFITANRSRVNFPKFIKNWPTSISGDSTHLYAIARQNSKLTSRQFVIFCKHVGAYLESADQDFKRLFNARLIEDVFLVEEKIFDSIELARSLEKDLKKNRIKLFMNTDATDIKITNFNSLQLKIKEAYSHLDEILTGKYVFNCTYSGLSQFRSYPKSDLKHEISEIALLKVPPKLANLGITIMDGPFFSLTPYPSEEQLHALSHVRYTPHLSWVERSDINPYDELTKYKNVSSANRMMRDARRYLPSIEDARYSRSIFEIKTVLSKNEIDDGRPIFIEKDRQYKNLYSILGGKIDNIYDVIERLNLEDIKA